ncbi:MAG: signal recognition particle protein [Mogibacterium diversum]|jgi:signal recognition particle protein|uniref:Signal recognition particle protein n=3 Tax=Mogibacterium diversum TaxID=114527 RepID=A0A2S0L4Z5_9FIRM|nr:signal recognition particle protein [Mogibacterium diversum]MBB1547177.1 signal recognition particle protein [Mogibacterium sp.]AVM48372.1 signal recognition particle protein [Mogibacterium diversum]MBF1328581.1 signal recognition particle protein [Mogibacterium diversum]MBF1338722.1 signal recognition particle protein [Mogibacterium diversum]MBF1355946.1 signal recognition particle protein [Mogibacterium diversum]
MAFEGLSEKLQETFRNLRGKGVVSEKDIDAAMREVKLALLEADVNFKVVKQFVATIKEKAMGADVLKSLTPGQQVLKIVKEELVDMMGGANSKLTYSPSGFTVYMMVGLQGTGKTTTCGKLAAWLKQNGKKPMLCACDVYRPAAIDQLEVVGKAVNTPVFTMRESNEPLVIAKAALEEAQRKGCNVLIVDTAGRLQIDEALMDELVQLKKGIRPHEILLAVDALTGQDAVNIAEGFNEKLGIDGIIMTKMDGDSRGGAALSTKMVTGKPIKFMGTGEKYNALEPFHPDRIASRILGMGDVMSLIEQAENAYTEEEAARMEAKFRKNQFDLNDFLEQMGQISKMGGIAKLIDMIPGISAADKKQIDFEKGKKDLDRMKAIIQSMTNAERENPNILNASRRKRIAAGSGQTVQSINQLIKQFDEMKSMMKKFNNPAALKKNKLFRGLMG